VREVSAPSTSMTIVTTRYVRIGLEQAIYDRARQAAETDRRSLANWVAVTVERALEEAGPEQERPTAARSTS
jgi:hypothetical protein